MTLIFKTKKINQARYYRAIRRCIILNSNYKAWLRFKKRWTVYVIPLSEAEAYKKFYKHLKLEGAGGMAWGVTGKDVLYWFVGDSRDPRIFMQNLGPGFHELLHALHQQEIGTSHVTYLTCGNPVGAACLKGKSGPAATVIVHDNWYGTKKKITLWFRHGGWIPMKMPYIPVDEAMRIYLK